MNERDLVLAAVADKIARSVRIAIETGIADVAATVETDYGDLVDACMASRPDLEPHQIADLVLSGEVPDERGLLPKGWPDPDAYWIGPSNGSVSPDGRWYYRDADGNVEWHDSPFREVPE